MLCNIEYITLINRVCQALFTFCPDIDIPRIPDDATTPPRPKRKEMQFFDENHVQQLLVTAMATDDRFSAFYHLAIAAGLRQGELLGLKWSDMDWEAGALQVQRQLSKKKGVGFTFTSPKTISGTRRISLGNATLVVLKEHQKNQFKEMISDIPPQH